MRGSRAAGASGTLAAPATASLTLHPPAIPNGIPVLTVHRSDRVRVRIFEMRTDNSRAGVPRAGMRLLSPAVEQPTFGGTRDVVYLIDQAPMGGRALRAEIEQPRGAAAPTFSFETLQHALARGAAHSHMIALAFGALVAMALAALSMWLILSDRMFVLYAGFIAMLALYLACFSGEARGWPGSGGNSSSGMRMRRFTGRSARDAIEYRSQSRWPRERGSGYALAKAAGHGHTPAQMPMQSHKLRFPAGGVSETVRWWWRRSYRSGRGSPLS